MAQPSGEDGVLGEMRLIRTAVVHVDGSAGPVSLPDGGGVNARRVDHHRRPGRPGKPDPCRPQSRAVGQLTTQPAAHQPQLAKPMLEAAVLPAEDCWLTAVASDSH